MNVLHAPAIAVELLEANLADDCPTGARQQLDTVLVADARARALWIAHRRLAVRIGALRPRADLAARAVRVATAQRPSQRVALAAAIVAKRKPQRRRTPRPARAWWRQALPMTFAALAIVGVLWAAWQQMTQQPTSAPLVAAPPPAPKPFAELHPASGNPRALSIGETLSADHSATVRWPDGSHADLRPGTRGQLTGDGIEVTTGAVSCEITHRTGTQPPFIVSTPHGRIRVVGTRFDVSIDHAASAIHVDDGTVEVAAADRAGPPNAITAGGGLRFDRTTTTSQTMAWRWPDAAIPIEVGIDHDGVLTSDIGQDNGQPWMGVHLGNNQQLFAWQPGLVLRAAVRASPEVRTINVQIYNQNGRRNYSGLLPNTGSGTWAVLNLELDSIRPYDTTAPACSVGDPMGGLVVCSESGTDGRIDIAWIAITGP